MVRATPTARAQHAFHHPIRMKRIMKSENAAPPQFLSFQETAFRIMIFSR
jgi:hypothetical protein